MDKNREGRQGISNNMAAPPNGLSSRRRHRSTGLRDSPGTLFPFLDEDGGQEAGGRLRDRGGVVVTKDRDRNRKRSIRSKTREHQIHHHHHHHYHVTANRDDGRYDTSEDSVNDEEGEDEADVGNDAALRMLPPPSSNPSTATATNHNNNNNHPQLQLNYRKTFPPSSNKVFRSDPAAPPPAWKATDEMIGVSIPRKARSAFTKRSHEWISSGGAVGGGGIDQINRQSSTSPIRLAASPAPLVAPPSPSSNISRRKKMEANGGGGGSKPRPPKSSSSNPEVLEIEIAEVLYGLMTRSQAPSQKENDSITKFDSSSDNKSRVSSPISNTTPPYKIHHLCRQ